MASRNCLDLFLFATRSSVLTRGAVQHEAVHSEFSLALLQLVIEASAKLISSHLS